MIPAPVDVRTLDPVEADLAGGLLNASGIAARAAVAKLRATDFTHAALVAVVRAVDVNLRADRPMSIANVSTAAVEGRVVLPKHRTHLDALLVDLTGPDVTMGEPALFRYRSLIERSVRRDVTALAVRAQQAVAEVTDPGELADVLDSLAAAHRAAAGRLQLEVIV